MSVCYFFDMLFVHLLQPWNVVFFFNMIVLSKYTRNQWYVRVYIFLNLVLNLRPFIEARALHHGLNMADEIGNKSLMRTPYAQVSPRYTHKIIFLKWLGFAPDSQKEYKSRAAIHMDCFRYGFFVSNKTAHDHIIFCSKLLVDNEHLYLISPLVMASNLGCIGH